MKVNVDMVYHKGGKYVLYKNRRVLSTDYPEYNTERVNTYNKIRVKHYDAMWKDKKIYA